MFYRLTRFVLPLLSAVILCACRTTHVDLPEEAVEAQNAINVARSSDIELIMIGPLAVSQSYLDEAVLLFQEAKDASSRGNLAMADDLYEDAVAMATEAQRIAEVSLSLQEDIAYFTADPSGFQPPTVFAEEYVALEAESVRLRIENERLKADYEALQARSRPDKIPLEDLEIGH